MANDLIKDKTVTYRPGQPGVPGSPGRPYIPARSAWVPVTRWQLVLVHEGLEGAEPAPGYGGSGVLSGGAQTSFSQYEMKWVTTYEYVTFPSQPAIPPIPPTPPTPAQQIVNMNIGWSGSARSVSVVNGDIRATFQLRTDLSGVVIGLNYRHVTSSYTDIRYGFYSSHGLLRIFESGVEVAPAPVLQPGDTLKIERRSGVVTYMKNDTELYVSRMQSTVPMFLDASLYMAGDQVNNPTIGGMSTGRSSLAPLQSVGSDYELSFGEVLLQPLEAEYFLHSGLSKGTASLRPLDGVAFGSDEFTDVDGYAYGNCVLQPITGIDVFSDPDGPRWPQWPGGWGDDFPDQPGWPPGWPVPGDPDWPPGWPVPGDPDWPPEWPNPNDPDWPDGWPVPGDPDWPDWWPDPNGPDWPPPGNPGGTGLPPGYPDPNGPDWPDGWPRPGEPGWPGNPSDPWWPGTDPNDPSSPWYPGTPGGPDAPPYQPGGGSGAPGGEGSPDDWPGLPPDGGSGGGGMITPSFAYGESVLAMISSASSGMTGEVGQVEASLLPFEGVGSDYAYTFGVGRLPYLAGYGVQYMTPGYIQLNSRSSGFSQWFVPEQIEAILLSAGVASSAIVVPVTVEVTIQSDGGATSSFVVGAQVLITLDSNGSASTMLLVSPSLDVLLESAADSDSVIVDVAILDILLQSDSPAWSGVLRDGGDAVSDEVGVSDATWVANTATNAISTYSGYRFNSFAKIGDAYYGCAQDGIYLLAGDADEGKPIYSVLALGKNAFGTSALKRVSNAYLGLRSGGRLAVRIGDCTQSYTYETRGHGDQIKARRVDIGRGISATYLEFEVHNMGGDDFEIDFIEFVVVPSKRRV